MIGDSVISLCVYTCGEVKTDGNAEGLFGEVVMFYYGCDVKVVTS